MSKLLATRHNASLLQSHALRRGFPTPYSHIATPSESPSSPSSPSSSSSSSSPSSP
ncbi:MAG: hypothetical protein KME21_28185 [Desmonostoc vinosum HA7617-LM4]|nr:hypothetical protein [Desmonostoc vinosum HA7617-LM4]